MEEEIDLREIIGVMIKRHVVILSVTGAFVLFSLIYAITRPAAYQSTALIEPALINKNPVESADSMSVLLKNPVNPYLKDIAQQLGVPEEKSQSIADRFDIADRSGYLLITSRSNSPQKAKQLADLVCSLIISRQNDIAKDAVRISSEGLASINQQIDYGQKDIEQLDKDISQKEKTTVLAQTYVFQALTQAKENKLRRQSELMDKLNEKEMEIRYFTKTAEIVAEASVPTTKIGPHRTKIVFISTIIGVILSVCAAFLLEYFEKDMKVNLETK